MTLLSNRRVEVPSPDDLLCESCGYTLNGLPDDGNCPECGEPIRNSIAGAGRGPTAYEIAPSEWTFWRVTAQVLFGPKRFYRSLALRGGPTDASRRFHFKHRVLVGIAVAQLLPAHLALTQVLSGLPFGRSPMLAVFVTLACAVLIVPLLKWIGSLAAKLSAVEAGWWGMRLPLVSVRRAMDYHAASYLPVALGALLIVWGYVALRLA